MNDALKRIIAPSLLSADFANIGRAIETINRSGAQWIHFDVMDGTFVPNITFGHKMVADARSHSRLTFDVHLMVESPDRHVGNFASAGADNITIHIEALADVQATLKRIKGLGKKAGLSIVPATPVSRITDLLPLVDQVLVMTVNPGFGGQTLITECLDKVVVLDELRERMGYTYLIEVDGGVTPDNAGLIFTAGADVLVSGSAFFRSDDPAAFVRRLSESA